MQNGLLRETIWNWTDFIQIGRMTLWELCLKYDAGKVGNFEGYVAQAIKWKIYREMLNTGMTIRVTTTATWEERQKFVCQSIDLHKDGETVNEYFAVSPVNVEDEVLVSMEVEGVMNRLNPEEQFILENKSHGFSDTEIGTKMGRSNSYVGRIKNKALFKLNPNYSPSYRIMAKPIKNHLRQQVI
ncbi:sigma-70 family RNA polymerase sigma factor [Bacillus thuringiensis]|uniref:sigma-70 family RNA polymerase sigma factor n=1 Tax=Bacillus thuringiensis TaxID=1428 RepID=UPI00333C3B19